MLFIAAAALGQLVGAGVLPRATAAEALYAAATPRVGTGCGCTNHEIRRAIRNGLDIGTTRPRRLQPRTSNRSTRGSGRPAA